MTAKEAFLGAVEDVVARCFVPVPSAPLIALSEAVAAGTESIESGIETSTELELLRDVYDAAECLDWRIYDAPWAADALALVHTDTVQTLVDALHAYREHLAHAR